ncbi:MAG: GNAT family N-acetyltransferase [bacterium]|nr:GNAT family N-acetyltransferase [bacterium]
MTRNHSHRISNRPYNGDEDFWRIRRLILETVRTTRLDFNWDVRRWDGWRFYSPDPAGNSRRSGKVQLWETIEGRLVGAMLSEGPGDVCPQLDPAFREIEEEMFVWAETNLTKPNDDGTENSLITMVFDYDQSRLDLLQKRGYLRTDMGGCIRRLQFGERELPERRALPAGYTLRSTRPDEADDQRIADLVNAAFNRDFHCAGESTTFNAHAPSFRRELDLVAEAPDGSFASYVGCPYDECNRRGIFEPVCTHPDHLRLGLAQTLMFEALHRLVDYGARDVTVGTGTAEAANRLYDSIGFKEVQKGSFWRIKLPIDG